METKKLEFSTLKGMPGAARINNLDAEVLAKAFQLNPNALIAKKDNEPVFIITETDGQSVVNDCSLAVNLNDINDGTLGICIVGCEFTLIQAVPYIVELYDKAKELADAFDKAKAMIKEV